MLCQKLSGRHDNPANKMPPRNKINKQIKLVKKDIQTVKLSVSRLLMCSRTAPDLRFV